MGWLFLWKVVGFSSEELAFDSGGIGADLLIPSLEMAGKPEVDLALTLFGESASRVILSVDKANDDKVMA